jgi:hypothetical protein
MKTTEDKIYSIKRADGKMFTVGDKFTYPHAGTTIVKGKPKKSKDRIFGFEKHDKGWYVLYMPVYSDGKKEKVRPWRACNLKSAIKLK